MIIHRKNSVFNRGGALALGLVFSLFLTSCGSNGKDAARVGRQGRGHQRAGVKGEGPPGRPMMPEASVAVEAVRRGDIETYYSATATLEANKQADVLARVAGIVKKPLVEEGDSVLKGQVLIEIEDAEYRHRLTQAEVDLEQQKSTLARTKKMLAQGLVSDEEADTAGSKEKAAQAAWELAKLELSYTRVEAPFGGRVITRHVDQGRTVSVGTPLFTLSDLSRLLAKVYVPAREFRKIQTDQPVQLVVDSSGEKLKGKILLVSPVVDPAAGTIKVTVAIDHFSSSTRPGDFAQVSIVTDRHEGVLLVPRTSVLTEHEEKIVYVVEDGHAHRRVVQPGYQDDSSTEIVSGLQDGENVVIQGQRSLSDGQEVRVLEKTNFDEETEPRAAPEN